MALCWHSWTMRSKRNRRTHKIYDFRKHLHSIRKVIAERVFIHFSFLIFQKRIHAAAQAQAHTAIIPLDGARRQMETKNNEHWQLC